jgi:hypothetical protein
MCLTMCKDLFLRKALPQPKKKKNKAEGRNWLLRLDNQHFFNATQPISSNTLTSLNFLNNGVAHSTGLH